MLHLQFKVLNTERKNNDELTIDRTNRCVRRKMKHIDSNCTTIIPSMNAMNDRSTNALHFFDYVNEDSRFLIDGNCPILFVLQFCKIQLLKTAFRFEFRIFKLYSPQLIHQLKIDRFLTSVCLKCCFTHVC